MTDATDRRDDPVTSIGYGGDAGVGLARRAAVATGLLQALLVLAVWLASRRYSGIFHDSRIYMGRMLADLDPTGLGRDPLFLLEKQTQLTIYSWGAGPLVRRLGVDPAAMALTLATLFAWLIAAAWLADRLMPRRFVPAALICVSVLSPVYGAYNLLSFGEPFTTPRGMAEVGVLAALAALMGARRRLAVALLAAAALMHAPTALAGLGVTFLILVCEAPALALLACAGGLAVATGGLTHLGAAKTLFQSYDKAWLDVMRVRTPFLFISRWPIQTWSQVIVPMTTLIIAMLTTEGRVRSVLGAVLAIALLGLVGAFAIGELPSNILILQLQTWRCLWLLKAMAALIAPLCIAQLWNMAGNDGRLVAILIGCTWLEIDSLAVALPLCALALMILALRRGRKADLLPVAAVWAAALCTFLLTSTNMFAEALAAVRLAGATTAPSVFLISRLLAASGACLFLIAATAIALSIKPLSHRVDVRALGFAGCLAVALPFTLMSWSYDPFASRAPGAVEAGAKLEKLIGPAPGGIVWLGNDVAPWFRVGRPTWVDYLQGTVGVFSRPLAMKWNARSKRLLADGLGGPLDRNPWAEGAKAAPPDLRRTAFGIVRLCRENDGPGAIIAPGDIAKAFGSGQALPWRDVGPAADPARPYPNLMLLPHRDSYTVIRCAPGLRLAGG